MYHKKEKIACPHCESNNAFRELCVECGGNGDTGAPSELKCTACNGTGTTDHYECDECGEVFDA